jgi:hypothetical protein
MSRQQRVVVTILQADPKDPDESDIVVKDYMVDFAHGETVRLWLSRTIYWAFGEGYSTSVEPFIGKPEDWREFRPKPPHADSRANGKSRRPNHRSFSKAG